MNSRIWIVSCFRLMLFAFVIGLCACGGEVIVSVPGCEECPDRCVQTGSGVGRCVECRTDKQCQSTGSPTRKCSNSRCVCGSDKDCPQQQVCVADLGCKACRNSEDCKKIDPNTPICSADKKCVQCNLGDTRACTPSGVEGVCVKGTQSCRAYAWTECKDYQVCSDGERCYKGKCRPDCPAPPPCENKGEFRCTTAPDVIPGQYKVCVVNKDGCFELEANDRFCGLGKNCSEGQCSIFECGKPACKLGETECVGQDEVRTCGRNKNGCIVWLPSEPCGKGKQCRKATGSCTLCAPGTKVNCYTGKPPETKDVGVCKAGTRTCVADGTRYGDCELQVLPKQELCNGLDDDCDGKTDEEWAKKGEACESGLGACKVSGNLVCKKNGLALECDATPKATGTTEVCNGKDDDCDGKTDEDFPRVTQKQACTAGKGPCKRTGVYICSKDAKSEVCSVAAGQAGAELCNNKDDDCDGVVDNGNPGGGKSCVVDRYKSVAGAPCRNGKTDCVSGKIVCKQTVFAAKETCNGKDDDCDGKIDGIKEDCFSGSTGCSRQSNGSYLCKGSCKSGVRTCTNGRWSGCSGQITSKTESCNGKDDDCDGSTDEGNPGGGGSCSFTQYPVGTPCRNGRRSCSGGRLVCVQLVKPVTEACNGKDDNCNGRTDENVSCGRGNTCGGSRGCYRCSQGGDTKCKTFLGVCRSSAPCPTCRCGLSCTCIEKEAVTGTCKRRGCR